MIYSRANLAVKDIAHKSKKEVALHRVHLENDGSSVATDGRALMAVGPSEERRAATFPDHVIGTHTAPEDDGVGVLPSQVAEVERMMPRGKAPLSYAAMTKCTDRVVELAATDGVSVRKRSSPPCRGKFGNWRAPLGQACRAATRGRIVIDRVALIRLLQAMDRACPDRGNYNATFLEFGGPEDAIILRAESYELGQRVIGMIAPLRAGQQWLEADEWETTIREAGVETKPTPKRVTPKRALPKRKGLVE